MGKGKKKTNCAHTTRNMNESERVYFEIVEAKLLTRKLILEPFHQKHFD